MKKIAGKLIDFGFDFNYEHHGSGGEEIKVHELDLEIRTYKGELFFEHEGNSEEFPENEKSFELLALKTEQLMIDARSSF